MFLLVETNVSEKLAASVFRFDRTRVNSDRPTARTSLLTASAIYLIRTVITATLKNELVTEILLFTNNNTRCHHPEDHHLNT